MSFAIKQDLEQREGQNEDNLFDIEAYNYLFNSRSSFMDGKFLREDTDELSHVLEHLQILNPAHLSILNYVRHFKEDD